jgi:hypothetical protein
MRFGILFSALAAILAGQSANGTAYEGERLAGYDVEPFGFIAPAVVIVFAPLFFFTPRSSNRGRRLSARLYRVFRSAI